MGKEGFPGNAGFDDGEIGAGGDRHFMEKAEAGKFIPVERTLGDRPLNPLFPTPCQATPLIIHTQSRIIILKWAKRPNSETQNQQGD